MPLPRCKMRAGSYPPLFVQDIIAEEGEGAVIILTRAAEGRHSKETPIGYLYSYLEQWGEGAGSDGPYRRTRRHRSGGGDGDDTSVYIAELFVLEEERGLGLGELLLAESLRLRCDRVSRSHLYVSSRNRSAVACYLKFGFGRSKTPSGDVNHDLVMELDSAQRSVVDAAHRMEQRLSSMDGRLHLAPRSIKATPPASPLSGYVSSSSSSRASPMLSVPPSPSESVEGGWGSATSSPPALKGGRRDRASCDAPLARGRITRGMAQQIRSEVSVACSKGGAAVAKTGRSIEKRGGKGRVSVQSRGSSKGVRHVMMLAMTYLKWGAKKPVSKVLSLGGDAAIGTRSSSCQRQRAGRV